MFEMYNFHKEVRRFVSKIYLEYIKHNNLNSFNYFNISDMTQILYAYISEDNHEFLLKEMLHDFPDAFRKKISQYRRWEDAQLSLLGRVLLKNGLKELNKDLNIGDLSYTEYNKPYFKNENVKFNISHSGNIVVCAIAENFEIGIDIEISQEIQLEYFKSQMTTLEWQRIIFSDDERNAFFEYWAQKEAVIKTHGMGLSLPLKSFEVINNQTIIKEEHFFLKEIPLDNKYKCFLAFKDKIDPIILSPKKIDPTSYISTFLKVG